MSILFVVFFATVFANSHEKYIDLLPEEEKQEFLEHVARRVMENVESKENASKNKFSIELTDEQLKEHNDFVQSILKEESEQMRRNKGGRAKADNDKKSDEELKVKPLSVDKDSEANDEKISTSDEAEEVTMNDVNQHNLEDEPGNYTDSKESATQNVTVQKRSIQSDEDSTEKDLVTESTVETKTEAAELIVSTKFADLTADKTTDSTITDKTEPTELTLPTGNYRRSLDTASGESETTTQNNTSTTDINDDTTTTATENVIESQISDTTANLPEQKPLVDNETKIEENIATTTATVLPEDASNTTLTSTTASIVTPDSKEKENIESTTADLDTSSVDSTISTTSTDEGTTAVNTEPTIEHATTETRPEKSTETNDDTKATTSSSEVETTTAESDIQNSTPDVEATTVKATTVLPVEGLTTTNLDLITKKPKKSKTKVFDIGGGSSSEITTNASKKVKGKRKKKTKVKVEGKFVSIQKEVFEETLKKDIECGIKTCNRYRVYEVHWPVSAEDQSPFLRSKDPIDDQPYFVPIYNYSPNKAYYNPENRRGPNAVEENSIDLDGLRNGMADIRDNVGKPEFDIDLNEIINKFSKYSKQTKYDKIAKLIMKKLKDNYKGVVLKSINLADDEFIPLGNLKGGLKNKIKTMRDVMYQNNYSKRHKRQKKEIDADIIKIHDIGNRDISMDYFYGRSNKNRNNNRQKNKNEDVLNNLFRGHEVVKVISFDSLPGETGTRAVATKSRNKKAKDAVWDNVTDKNFNDLNEDIERYATKDDTTHLAAKNNDVKFNSYMNALKDLISQDNIALKQYNWLATTVQIHAGLSKLLELINRVQNSEAVHPADLQILKYVMFLHNFAVEIRQASHHGSKLRNKLLLPRNKKARQYRFVKDKGLLNRVWLYLRTLMPDLSDQDGLKELNQLLFDIEDGFYDLHEAFKNIAKVTTFKKQNWYRNLKDLYLTTEEKHLRELLLHISFARLIDLIEYSCRSGVEDDFVTYMKSHRSVAKRTLDEMLFVMKIVDEINNNSA